MARETGTAVGLDNSSCGLDIFSPSVPQMLPSSCNAMVFHGAEEPHRSRQDTGKAACKIMLTKQ